MDGESDITSSWTRVVGLLQNVEILPLLAQVVVVQANSERQLTRAPVRMPLADGGSSFWKLFCLDGMESPAWSLLVQMVCVSSIFTRSGTTSHETELCSRVEVLDHRDRSGHWCDSNRGHDPSFRPKEERVAARVSNGGQGALACVFAKPCWLVNNLFPLLVRTNSLISGLCSGLNSFPFGAHDLVWFLVYINVLLVHRTIRKFIAKQA